MCCLLMVFIVSKWAGWIDWSWWWVLSPLWVGLFVTDHCRCCSRREERS